MSVSINEIVLLALISLGCWIAIKRTQRRWIWAIPLFMLFAVLITPADPVSTLIVGVPNCVLFGVVVGRYAKGGTTGPDALTET